MCNLWRGIILQIKSDERICNNFFFQVYLSRENASKTYKKKNGEKWKGTKEMYPNTYRNSSNVSVRIEFWCSDVGQCFSIDSNGRILLMHIVMIQSIPNGWNKHCKLTLWHSSNTVHNTYNEYMINLSLKTKIEEKSN